MIYEKSRDELTKDLHHDNQEEIEQYIEYAMKIEVKIINEVLEFLGVEAKKKIHPDQPDGKKKKFERPNFAQIEEEEKEASR